MKWQEPPTPRRSSKYKTKTDLDVEELRANPGAWALVAEKRVGNSARQKYVQRGCEARSYRHPGGLYDVYARWPVVEDGPEGVAP